MKRIIVAVLMVLALCVSLFSFVGCGAKVASDFVVPENGYDGSEVTIKFYHTMGANLREVLERYIVEFNKRHIAHNFIKFLCIAWHTL